MAKTNKGKPDKPKQKRAPSIDEQANDWMNDWQEKRYGAKRDKLSRAELEMIARNLAGYEHDAAADLVLLMDEIERSRFQSGELDNITLTVRDTAFQYTCDSSKACDAMIESMRARLKGGAR